MDIFSNPLLFALLILSCTAFLKLLTVGCLFRVGLGLHGGLFGLVMVFFALVLTFFIAEPLVQEQGGWSAYSQVSDSADFMQKFAPVLSQHTDQKIYTSLAQLQDKLAEQQQVATTPLPANNPPEAASAQSSAQLPVAGERPGLLVASFMLSELRTALYIGLIILIPFLVIDFTVSNVLTALNITQLQSSVVSLPLKLLLFYFIDGWHLLTEKIVNTYLS